MLTRVGDVHFSHATEFRHAAGSHVADAFSVLVIENQEPVRESNLVPTTVPSAKIGVSSQNGRREFVARSLDPVLRHRNRTIEKISQGDMMVFRSSAAMCGVVILLATSVTAARSETGSVHSSAIVNAAGAAIVGAASTYNPFRPGWREGSRSTASGERYDPSGWAAAIKTSLRQKFGGVQYGAKPKFALVEAVGKKVIVKINDVGPLTPGRIIDLNERTMRHFDPSMHLGVIHDVTVTPLSGANWVAGPIDGTSPAKEAGHGNSDRAGLSSIQAEAGTAV